MLEELGVPLKAPAIVSAPADDAQPDEEAKQQGEQRLEPAAGLDGKRRSKGQSGAVPRSAKPKRARARAESLQRPLTVTKSNRLIEAGYRITLAEQRVLLAILTQINTHPNAPPITGDTPFELTAGGFADLFQTDRDQAYEQLKDASGRLGERWVVIDAPDPENPALAQTKTRWVQRFDYLPTQGRIRVYLANAIIPYVSSLAGAFTRYRIQSIVRLTSVYAIRLYELLVQWQTQGEREVTVDWLRDRFQLADAYPSTYELQRRVIRPAVEQVTEHTNIPVTYAPRQVGRSIVAFQFRFTLKASQQPAPLAPVDPADNGSFKKLRRADIERLARPGETWGDAINRLTSSRS
ncbi:MAG: RepB family plasmid replication initiator protein [Chromatiaceae bacterium]